MTTSQRNILDHLGSTTVLLMVVSTIAASYVPFWTQVVFCSMTAAVEMVYLGLYIRVALTKPEMLQRVDAE